MIKTNTSSHSSVATGCDLQMENYKSWIASYIQIILIMNQLSHDACDFSGLKKKKNTQSLIASHFLSEKTPNRKPASLLNIPQKLLSQHAFSASNMTLHTVPTLSSSETRRNLFLLHLAFGRTHSPVCLKPLPFWTVCSHRQLRIAMSVAQHKLVNFLKHKKDNFLIFFVTQRQISWG